MIRTLCYCVSIISLLSLKIAIAEDAAKHAQPRPIPLTRPEMKRLLEDMKERTPRIPLPELTDEDRAKLGPRADSYESRLRYHYLPGGDNPTPRTGNAAGTPRGGGLGGFGFGGMGREPDPDMSLDYAFKTQLFWIVSRTNNCQYCLGHQESKLLGAGMTEDEIAALDGDWTQFEPRQRAAYAFARKITFEPHRISDSDLQSLREYFTDKQILEMLLSVVGNNSINRWKEGAGIPQSTNGGNFGGRTPGGAGAGKDQPAARETTTHSYLTPTSPRFQSTLTHVAPVTIDPASGKPTTATKFQRPPLESRAEVEETLVRGRGRKARLPLVDKDAARKVLPDDFPQGPIPAWALLLANFPNSARGRIQTIRTAETSGDLSPLLKAQASWIIARQDRAWYAAAEARRRLLSLGWTDDQIFALDGSWDALPDRERSLFTLASKLAATPVVLTDVDVEQAVRAAGPRLVTQMITYTAHRAAFNRLTETAGLTVEP